MGLNSNLILNLKCPKCGENIPYSNVNTIISSAKCSCCGEVFKFTNFPDVSNKPHIDKPKGVTVRNENDELVITWSWFKLINALVLVPFLLLVFIFSFLKPEILINFDDAFNYLVFLPLFVFIGGFYWGLCVCINRTEIRVNSQLLTIRHFPLPFSKNISVKIMLINQLYCMDYASANNGHNPYSVEMLLTGGEHKTLVSGFGTKQHALFIEQEIERYLGIADRPVVGEMRQ